MLRGERVTLRARHQSDVPILEADIRADVELVSRADARPWRPVSPGSPASDVAIREPTEASAAFTIVLADNDDVVGETSLWGIDPHHRQAHIGLSLRPSHQGKGLGSDAVRVLCRYAFVVLGLHRVQIETLADNQAMIATAQRVGFTREGVLRKSVWLLGEFVDQHVFGMLRDEWIERYGRS